MSDIGNMHLVTGYAARAHITSADHGAFHAAMFGSGDYVLQLGDQFAASVSGGVITVKGGHLLMQGRYAYKADNTVFAPSSVSTRYYRHDLIVASYSVDTSSGVESATLKLIEGVASMSPADPEIGTVSILDDTFSAGDTHDFPLWRVVWNGNTARLEQLYGLSGSYVGQLAAMEATIGQLLDNMNKLARTVPDFQYGTASIRFRSDKESSATVTFPSAYKEKPLVLTTQIFDGRPIVVKNEDITTTGFTAWIGTVEGGGASGEPETTREFSWVAMSKV